VSTVSDLHAAAEILRHLGAHGTALQVDNAGREHERVVDECRQLRRLWNEAVADPREIVEQHHSEEVKP
jgi:hypothetical protein